MTVNFHLCLVHVIWTEPLMLRLVLNVKYLLLLTVLTANEFLCVLIISEGGQMNSFTVCVIT